MECTFPAIIVAPWLINKRSWL